jgi:hypothetical protein
MNTLTKQTVIFPFGENGLPLHHSANVDECMKSYQKQEGYFFTPEELNEYTANVIKQALETAAEKAVIEQKGYFEASPEECLKGIEIYDDNGSDRPSHIVFLDKESITNTFEQTFQKYKV